MLTRCLLGVCSQSIFTSGTENCRFFGAPNCDLGGLLPQFWHPWGAILPSWGHPGRHWEQQGGHVGIQGRISVDFGMIWDPILRVFRAPMARNLVLFLGSVPCRSRHRFLDRNPGTWGSQNEVFVWKVLQKPTFRRNWKSQDLRINFA